MCIIMEEQGGILDTKHRDISSLVSANKICSWWIYEDMFSQHSTKYFAIVRMLLEYVPGIVYSDKSKCSVFNTQDEGVGSPFCVGVRAS